MLVREHASWLPLHFMGDNKWVLHASCDLLAPRARPVRCLVSENGETSCEGRGQGRGERSESQHSVELSRHHWEGCRR